ncbi:hypothetical protein [Jatrophihabitans lederbergiae]|uniref:GGDEF domain-containing protein n=1 Tax=Jatrophihabitans lederbergiae TaxID=3075547 RepID=A0ABU2JB49_9ACTN|nr:hypothetical protein [Jatrophihabitans sp. DSM 44399]MDT0262215.1 hypothetical protein [Jatrophihabitans sp. DSM 44399]
MRKALKSIPTWTLWGQPKQAVVVLLGVELLSVLLPWTSTTSITAVDLGEAALLASLSIAYSVFTITWERIRVFLRNGEDGRATCPNLLATWTFAAAVMLPLRLAILVTVASSFADWRARNVGGQTKLYRYVYSTAAVLLAVATASSLHKLALPYGAALPLAGLAYMSVNIGLVGVAIASVGQYGALKPLFKPSTYRIEVLTLAIAGVEVLMTSLHIPLVGLSLPAAVFIQRKAGRTALREADEQAAPMAERVWVHVARGVVAASETVSVLRIDTNDPRAASELARMQAGCDAIGYYGGGAGLAILLVDCPGSNADALAARMRSALSHGGVEARVAVAAKPRDGQRLEDLLVVTEADLVTFDSANDAPEAIPPQP